LFSSSCRCGVEIISCLKGIEPVGTKEAIAARLRTMR
jgi:hypothetical protein